MVEDLFIRDETVLLSYSPRKPIEGQIRFYLIAPTFELFCTRSTGFTHLTLNGFFYDVSHYISSISVLAFPKEQKHILQSSNLTEIFIRDLN